MSNTASATDSSSHAFHLSLRLERPIADCELQPHPFLSVRGGNLDNAGRNKLLDANPHIIQYQWHRGMKKPACAYPDCPRRYSSDPIVWSKFARGGYGLRCAMCERNHVPSEDSSFCSRSCFQSAWKKHSLMKHVPVSTSTSTNNSRDSSNDDYLDDDKQSLPDSPVPLVDDERSDWQMVSSDKIYTPTSEDIGCRLSVEVTAVSTIDNAIIAGPVNVISEPVLSSPTCPPKRALTMIPGAAVGTSTAVARFRVMSYNILSELYATKQAYPYCDAWMLSWPYRRKMLIQEVEEAQADLVCLQEVQADHFEQQLKPVFADMGYESLFRQKSRESMGQYGKVDGCAVLWRRSKFALIESYTIDFNDCAMRTARSIGLDEAECRRYINRLSKDNIAQVLLLEATSARTAPTQSQSRNTRQLICLANTHLYSNYQRPDVKLWQTYALISEIERIVISRDIPLILCGDFNSEPESAVYELLVRGMLEQSHPELEERGDSRILPQLHSIMQSLELSSVMAASAGTEPSFTNYTSKFRGTLDYIFYSPSRLRVLATSAVPSEKDIEQSSGEGLPSACYPSDHVHLCCDVALLPPSAGSITRHIARESGKNASGYLPNEGMGGGYGDSSKGSSRGLR